MLRVTATIKGVSPYSSSRYHETQKKTKEGADDYEKRTWREKAHFDSEGMCYIPPMAFKSAIADAAQMLAIRIPGKGVSTYTKHFGAGVLVTEPLPLNVHKDEAEMVKVYCHADGKRNSGKRVMRYFPQFAKWGGTLEFLVADSTITADVFERHLKEAGLLIGVGRFRPQNRGLNGRFQVMQIEFHEHDLGGV